MAILAATVRNSFISKASDAASPADFLPDWTARPEDEEAGFGDDP